MPSFWQRSRRGFRPAAGFILGLALCAGPYPTATAAARAGGPDPASAHYKKATLLLDDLRSVPDYELGPEQYLLVINAFRKVYGQQPSCASCDASLLAAGNLYREMAGRFSDTAYRSEALKTYRLLLQVSPRSALAHEAEKAVREIEVGVPAKIPAAKPQPKGDSAGAQVAETLEIGEDVAEDEEGVEVGTVEAGTRETAGNEATKNPAPGLLQAAPPAAEDAQVVLASARPAAPPSSTKGRQARVKEVRFWTHPTYTRVIVEIDGRVEHTINEVSNPDRLYIDLLGSLLPTNYRKQGTIEVNDSLLQRIRLGQNTLENTRVVFDLQQRPHYTTSWLANPPRLVIEFREQNAVLLTQASKATADGSGSQQLLASAASIEKALPSARDTRIPDSKPAPARFAEAPPPAAAKPEPVALATLRTPEARIGIPETPMVKDPVDLSKVKPPQPDLPPPRPAAATSSGNRNLIRALGLKVGRVVIDAGHGGHDTGSIGPTGLREKDLVLDVATRLGKLIQDGMGSEVIYTRTDDTFLSPQKRTRVANASNADLFISVHANSVRDERVRGVETYYLNFTTDSWAMAVASRENAASEQSVHELQDLVSKIALKESVDESREFAGKIQAALHAGLAGDIKGLRNRGVRKAPLIVLIGAKMPSVLAEIGFLSNPKDEKLFKSVKFRQKIAQHIYDGIAAYAETLSHVNVAQKQEVTP